MYDRKRKGNSCKKGQTLLACNHKSFTEPSHKMFDRDGMNKFIYFKDLLSFSFCVFAI